MRAVVKHTRHSDDWFLFLLVFMYSLFILLWLKERLIGVFISATTQRHSIETEMKCGIPNLAFAKSIWNAHEIPAVFRLLQSSAAALQNRAQSRWINANEFVWSFTIRCMHCHSHATQIWLRKSNEFPIVISRRQRERDAYDNHLIDRTRKCNAESVESGARCTNLEMQFTAWENVGKKKYT